MKSIVISSVVTALLVLTGCSDKEPVVDTSKDASTNSNKSGYSSSQNGNTSSVVVDAVEEETIHNSNALSGNGDMSSIESKFTSIYFDFDKFTININNRSAVEQGAHLATTFASAYTIKLEGNCDEFGSDEYNFALGLKRANSVKKSLVAEGVNSNRITMVSYGESNPSCSEKTDDCWAKNRRVDFKLLP